uniref:Uncharacterized protein n=1 Tax=Quercus lobata TaxID=97700 RepID=A0A7N2LN98_QUELO
MQNQSDYEIVDVEPSVKDAPVIAEHSVELTHSVSVEDIIRKAAMYFKLDNGIHSRDKSVLEKRINILRELYNCEFWLEEQFWVKTFKSLGFGEFLMILEKHASPRSDEIHKFLTGDICEKSPLEDLVFSPSLGPLVPWLLNEVKAKELLCLVTKDGKVMRIDHSATVDSFLEAALQGSPFQTSVQLLSLFSLVGREKYVPLSLLKFHARRAFEVILKNSLESGEVNDNQNSPMQGNTSYMQKIVDEADTHAEFCGFAADVLLSGMRPVIKDANSAILCECNQREERVMLHEVGLSLGIVEWIDDYHAFCSADATNFFPFGASCLEAAGLRKALALRICKISQVSIMNIVLKSFLLRHLVTSNTIPRKFHKNSTLVMSHKNQMDL